MPSERELRLWKAFESDIGRMFRAAGYQTEENVEWGGQEFDIIATKRNLGSFDVRIAVECKYRTERSVSNAEIHEFISAFVSAKTAHNLTWGIVVTNHSFSRQAHEASSDHQNVKLMTRGSLEDELLGARAYLESTETIYRSGARGYLPLSASLVSEPPARSKVSKDIAQECVSRAGSESRSFVFLLGDFGSGKTTVAEQVHRQLACSYLAGETTVFPVILYLRTLEQHDSEDSFIDAHLKASSAEFNIPRLRALEKRAPLAYILDGFDEIATNASEEERLRLFTRAMRVARRAQHVLLTSRPSYFNSLSELNTLVETLIKRDYASAHGINTQIRRRDGFAESVMARQQEVVQRKLKGGEFATFPQQQTSIYFINPLTREDIVSYFRPHSKVLKSRYRMTPEEVYEFLSGVYDLTDLLTRPLLLDMFVELVLAGTVALNDPDLQIGPAGLYHLYVNLHLERDWGIRRFLRPAERLAFARAAAIAMLEAGGSLEATYESIRDLVREGQSIFEPARRELMQTQTPGVVTDVRLCSFMNMTQRGRIEFSHKSFMEYFVSDVIAAQLAGLRPITILRRNLNYEILYFLGSYCLIRAGLRVDILQHLQHVGSGESEAYRANLKVALMFSERVSLDRVFRDFEFRRVRIAKKGFEGCQFIDVALRSIQITDTYFISCSFDCLELQGEVTGVQITSCIGVIAFACVPERLLVEDCEEVTLGGLGRTTFLLVEPSWLRSVIRLPSPTTLSEANVRDSTLVLGDGADLTVTGGSFRNVCIKSADVVAVLPMLKISNARVTELLLDFVMIEADTFVAAERIIRRCKGVVFIKDTERRIQAFFRADSSGVRRYHNWEAGPSLLLINYAIFRSLGPSARDDLQRVFRGDATLEAWTADHLKHLEAWAGDHTGHAERAQATKRSSRKSRRGRSISRS